MNAKNASELTPYIHSHVGRQQANHREVGSAPVEFILVLVPIFFLLQTLSLVLAKGQLDAAAVTHAAELAQVCALADADDAALAAVSDAKIPNWIFLTSATCESEGSFARLQIRVEARGFPLLAAEVSWHAARETQ